MGWTITYKCPGCHEMNSACRCALIDQLALAMTGWTDLDAVSEDEAGAWRETARAVLPIIAEREAQARRDGAIEALAVVEAEFLAAVKGAGHHETCSEEYDSGSACDICEVEWPCEHAGYCLDAAKLVAAHRQRIERGEPDEPAIDMEAVERVIATGLRYYAPDLSKESRSAAATQITLALDELFRGRA